MILTPNQRIFSEVENLLGRKISWTKTTLWAPCIDNDVKGVYIVRTKKHILYVGKGSIRSRLNTHEQKLSGDLRGAKMTHKFKLLHEAKLAPPIVEVYVEFFECNATERSMCEGYLIHKLQPPLNDEVECNLMERLG
jgi:hypothetical protein